MKTKKAEIEGSIFDTLLKIAFILVLFVICLFGIYTLFKKYGGAF